MPMMLCRPPTAREKALRPSLNNVEPQWTHTGFPATFWEGQPSPDPFYSAVMSLIELPPESSLKRQLCKALLASPEFLAFLANPKNFSRIQLRIICRALMSVEPCLDARLACAVAGTDEDEADPAVVLHVLSVLDSLSPGGRLVMPLRRLQRDAGPLVASKVALMFGRRVQNPEWAARLMAEGGDERVRANVIESLWGSASFQARKTLLDALHDPYNRVVGNALLGLHMLGDKTVPEHLERMIRDDRANFRSTAAWVMGRTGDQRYGPELEAALTDPDPGVRKSAVRALAALPTPVHTGAPAETAHAATAGAIEPGTASVLPEPTPAPAPAATAPDRDTPAAPDFDLHLDGSVGALTKRR
jgi:hypothetical protein